jgi:osomolarity two-component system phosphorelay intermediate protein YPD1
MKDEAGTADVRDEAKCLERIKETLKDVKEEYAEVEKVLKRFYGSQ